MANIKEIARAAGVSVATVSRVLNGHPYVSEAKRRAVEKAMEQLQYARNMNAVHLIKGTTETVGVILPQINYAYFAQLMEGIAEGALRHNYQLMLCQTGYRPEEEMKVLRMLRNKQIDGVIICSRSLPLNQIGSYAEYGPIVLCEDAGDLPLSSVFFDHYAAFRKAILYLWKKGHRDIGFTLNRKNSQNSLRRRNAYKDTLRELGGRGREEWMLDGCTEIRDGRVIADWLLGMNERPSALLINGDEVAAGCLVAARERGLRIPDDIAIVGFDNQPISEMFGITTIDNRLSDIGIRAFEAVYEQIRDPGKGRRREELPFRLIERSTV
ncbi:LacI family DNA-binding transcriptional regulator [Paenibacillus sp. DYY-L-2]|uniref:LacI family DNA-binding transcriptional regulator n=1 Tax=Paenibacillus sp. DYY-L-2 TaxID=3447013 RepID=UPI003F4F6B47